MSYYLLISESGVDGRIVQAATSAHLVAELEQHIGDGKAGAIQIATIADITSGSAAQSAKTSEANRAAVLAKAQAALTANATFLALASPTNAQTLAQVQRLSRQMDGVLRVLSNLLDDVSDT